MVIYRTLKNPLVGAAFICAAAVYGGIIPVKNRNEFRSAVRFSSISSITGRIVSNPVKIPKMRKYSVQFEPAFVKNSENLQSSCSGRLTVMLDDEMVEAYFPGKLYSACREKGALICETGAVVGLRGKAGRNSVYFADRGYMIGWDGMFGGKIAHMRALCRIQFRRLMYAWGAAGGLLLALLSGVREYTESVTADAFRNAGVSHILALSGMHLSIVSGLAAFAGTQFCGKKNAYVFQVCAVLFFVWFAGLSPSLLRALICSIILLLLSFCSFTNVSMISVLCASFLLHCVIVPADLSNAAFMLSYGALAGILITGSTINMILCNIVPTKLSESFSSSAGAQLCTAPVTLKLFGTVMPGGILASVVLSPAVAIFMYAGLGLIVLCLLCPFFAGPSGFVMNAIYTVIKLFVMLFARIPGITVTNF
jgi:ComEC/Rec2-related protein